MCRGRDRTLVAPPLGQASTPLEIESYESLVYWLLRDSLATAQQRAFFRIRLRRVVCVFNGNIYILQCTVLRSTCTYSCTYSRILLDLVVLARSS